MDEAQKEEAESLIERLKFALDNQIEWQKYAENKNLLLFTVSGATLLAIFDKYKDAIAINDVNEIIVSSYFKFFIITTLISFILSVSAYFVLFFLIKPNNKKIHIISWNYVRRKKLNELKKIVQDYNLQQHIDDILFQHLAGSKLTYIKYVFFNTGIIFYFLGVIILLIPMVKHFFNL